MISRISAKYYSIVSLNVLTQWTICTPCRICISCHSSLSFSSLYLSPITAHQFPLSVTNQPTHTHGLWTSSTTSDDDGLLVVHTANLFRTHLSSFVAISVSYRLFFVVSTAVPLVLLIIVLLLSTFVRMSEAMQYIQFGTPFPVP